MIQSCFGVGDIVYLPFLSLAMFYRIERITEHYVWLKKLKKKRLAGPFTAMPTFPLIEDGIPAFADEPLIKRKVNRYTENSIVLSKGECLKWDGVPILENTLDYKVMYSWNLEKWLELRYTVDT